MSAPCILSIQVQAEPDPEVLAIVVPAEAPEILVIVVQEGNGSGAVAWVDVSGKPELFPPEAHGHAIGDVTGLQDELDGKAEAVHSHALSDLAQSGASTGQIARWNGSAWVPSDEAGGGVGPAAKLTVDVTINDNMTLQDITGLAVNLAANTDYRFELHGVVVTSANGTGYELGVTGPASPDFLSLEGRIYNGSGGGNSAGIRNHLTGYGQIAANANGGTVGVTAMVYGSIRTGAAGGLLQFTSKVETSVTGSVTWKSGSRIFLSPPPP